MNGLDNFPPTYCAARERFRQAAAQHAVPGSVYPIQVDGRGDEDLAMDVAVVGSAAPKWSVIVSSGLHGVEGFFGSAVQSAWLQSISKDSIPEGGRVVLLHAVNPYGFDTIRRVNEDNADLNRNFLSNKSDYSGAPDGYAELDGFLNPPSPPSGLEPFLLKALLKILRHGMSAFKGSVAGGQYQFPKGLFFGGQSLSQSAQIVSDNLMSWVGDARDIVHIDLHSGLGKFGKYKFLVPESSGEPELEWYRESFGTDVVERIKADGIAFRVKGLLGDWAAEHLTGRNYRFGAAEFGTHSVFRVLGALRAENRAHFYCKTDDPRYQRAKAELLECFCPASKQWRASVLQQGLQLIERAVSAASKGRAKRSEIRVPVH